METDAQTREVIATLLKRYRKDPVFFVEHALGHLTWSKQRDILWSVRDNEKTAVQSSHGVSKTFSAAEIAIWFLNCFDNSKVVTTAPTYTQIKKLLWSEVNADYMRSRFELEGECLTTEIKTAEADHYAIGFSTDTPARSEGWHAPAILFIFDEGKGIPTWLWNSVRGSMTGGFCRWLVISTTDGVQVGDEYWKIFQGDTSEWNRIRISAFDSPYVTGEKLRGIELPDPTRPDRFKRSWKHPAELNIQIATPKYIDQCRKDWGEESVLYLTKVLGMIVDAGADSIIKLSQAMAMFRNWDNAAFNAEGAEEGGIDVARGGDDDTTFTYRKGLKVVKRKIIPSSQLPEKEKLVFIADEAESFFEHNKKMRIKIDDTGVGGGLTDIMQSRKYAMVPINFGEKASDPDKYPNAVSEMWFEVGKIVQEIACPQDDRLLAELVNRRSKGLDKKGRRVVESKKEYKERNTRSPDQPGRSPDVADSFLLAFYNPAGTAQPRIERV
jgi:phage terminase large subunit